MEYWIFNQMQTCIQQSSKGRGDPFVCVCEVAWHVQNEVTMLRAELATMGAKREAAQRSLEHAISRTDRVMASIKEVEDVRTAETGNLERASEEPERAKHAADLLVATLKELHGQEEQLLSQLQSHSSAW